jgi:hypothetical protein
MLEIEIVPRLDALRAKKQTYLKFQNLKSEKGDIENYLILFDYVNTLVNHSFSNSRYISRISKRQTKPSKTLSRLSRTRSSKTLETSHRLMKASRKSWRNVEILAVGTRSWISRSKRRESWLYPQRQNVKCTQRLLRKRIRLDKDWLIIWKNRARESRLARLILKGSRRFVT